tara:strand:+ start:63 stop:182 length:120 start_codon:yes stop_codon:yes gene_type:complete
VGVEAVRVTMAEQVVVEPGDIAIVILLRRLVAAEVLKPL